MSSYFLKGYKMSQKIKGKIDSSKPIRMWMDGKRFNLKQFQEHKKNKHLKSSDLSDRADNEELLSSVKNQKINFDIDDNGRMSVSFELPCLYYIKLKQNDFFDLNSIRTKTNTIITIPSPNKEGEKIIISGDNETKLKDALDEVHSVIGQIRNRARALQFIAIPLLSDEITNKFEQFKNNVLQDKDTRGLDESIFQSALKLHLTIDVMVLLNDREKQQATEALQRYNEDILKPLLEKSGPLKIHVKGIECMNDNYSKVDVLYAEAKVINETDEINLQTIANSLSDYFYERGLLKQHQENVKLHMTLMNSKYRREPHSPKKRWAKRQSFDATKIMEKYKDFEFGMCDLNTIHISYISSIGEDGFYRNLSSIVI